MVCLAKSNKCMKDACLLHYREIGIFSALSGCLVLTRRESITSQVAFSSFGIIRKTFAQYTYADEFCGSKLHFMPTASRKEMAARI